MTRGHRLPDLAARRIAAGLSISRLAKLANVSDLTIIQLENGGNCDEYVSARILAALGTPVPIDDSSVADPTVITTTVAHPFISGDTATIAGHSGSDPDVNGDHVVSVQDETSFTIDVAVTTGGEGGTAGLAGATLGLVSLR